MSNRKNWNKKLALLSCSLVIMLPFRIVITMAGLCAVRFNLDPSYFSTYIRLMVNAAMMSQQFGCWVGVIITSGWATGPVKLWVLARANWAEFACLCLTLFCFCHSEDGHLTGFYWSIALANFWWKVSEQACVSIAAPEIDYYFAGYTFSWIWSALLKALVLTLCRGDSKQVSVYSQFLEQVTVELELVGKLSVKTTVDYRSCKWIFVVTIFVITLVCVQWTAISIMLTTGLGSLDVGWGAKEEAVEAVAKAVNGWRNMKKKMERGMMWPKWMWAERDSSAVGGTWTAHSVSFIEATVKKVEKTTNNYVTVTVKNVTYQTLMTKLDANEWWRDNHDVTDAVNKLSLTWTKTETKVESKDNLNLDKAIKNVKMDGQGIVTFTVHVERMTPMDEVEVKKIGMSVNWFKFQMEEYRFDFDNAWEMNQSRSEDTVTVTLKNVKLQRWVAEYEDDVTREKWEKLKGEMERTGLRGDLVKVLEETLKKNVKLTKVRTKTVTTEKTVDFSKAKATTLGARQNVEVAVDNVMYKKTEGKAERLSPEEWETIKREFVGSGTVEAEVTKKAKEQLVKLMDGLTGLNDNNVRLTVKMSGKMTITISDVAAVDGNNWQEKWQEALTKTDKWETVDGLKRVWDTMDTKDLKKVTIGWEGTEFNLKDMSWMALKNMWAYEGTVLAAGTGKGQKVEATDDNEVTIRLSDAGLDERMDIAAENVMAIAKVGNTVTVVLKLKSGGTYTIEINTSTEEVTYSWTEATCVSSSATEDNDLTISVDGEDKSSEWKKAVGGWHVSEIARVFIHGYNKAQNVLVEGKALTVNAETWMSVATAAVMGTLVAVPFSALFAAIGRYCKCCGQTTWAIIGAVLGAVLGATAGGGGSLVLAVTGLNKDSVGQNPDWWGWNDKTGKVWKYNKAWTWINKGDWARDTKAGGQGLKTPENSYEKAAVWYGTAIGLGGGAAMGAIKGLCAGACTCGTKAGIMLGALVGAALGTIAGTVWKAVTEGKINGDDHAPLVTAGSMAACVFGMGTVYSVYPGMAPYSITDFQYFDSIDIIILTLSAIGPIVIMALDMCLPNWKGHLGGPEQNLTTTLKVAVVIAVALLVAQIICQIITICVLQYPDSELAQKVTSSSVRAGTLTVTMVFGQLTGTGIGMSGVFAASGFNVGIQKLNLVLTLAMGELTGLFADGYLTELKKYDPGIWPTQGMGNWDSYKWWNCRVFSNAWQILTRVCTTDLRRDIMLCNQ